MRAEGDWTGLDRNLLFYGKKVDNCWDNQYWISGAVKSLTAGSAYETVTLSNPDYYADKDGYIREIEILFEYKGADTLYLSDVSYS